MFTEIVVLTKPLDRGTKVSRSDVTLKRMELTGNHQHYFTEIEDVLDKVAKRPLAAGTQLTWRKLTLPKAIRRGQKVLIIAQQQGMAIKMDGSALMDGVTGQRISVRNNSSKRIVEGTITSPGVVTIKF